MSTEQETEIPSVEGCYMEVIERLFDILEVRQATTPDEIEGICADAQERLKLIGAESDAEMFRKLKGHLLGHR